MCTLGKYSPLRLTSIYVDAVWAWHFHQSLAWHILWTSIYVDAVWAYSLDQWLTFITVHGIEITWPNIDQRWWMDDHWWFIDVNPLIKRLLSSLTNNDQLIMQAVKHTIKIKAENCRVAQLLAKNSLKWVMFPLNWRYMCQIYSSKHIVKQFVTKICRFW